MVFRSVITQAMKKYEGALNQDQNEYTFSINEAADDTIPDIKVIKIVQSTSSPRQALDQNILSVKYCGSICAPFTYQCN